MLQKLKTELVSSIVVTIFRETGGGWRGGGGGGGCLIGQEGEQVSLKKYPRKN